MQSFHYSEYYNTLDQLLLAKVCNLLTNVSHQRYYALLFFVQSTTVSSTFSHCSCPTSLSLLVHIPSEAGEWVRLGTSVFLNCKNWYGHGIVVSFNDHVASNLVSTLYHCMSVSLSILKLHKESTLAPTSWHYFLHTFKRLLMIGTHDRMFLSRLRYYVHQCPCWPSLPSFN